MKKNSAFSLIELSIVILVIGIILVGITAGSKMVQDSRINSARQMTSSSIVNDIEGLHLWLEPTLPFVFAKGSSPYVDAEYPVDGDLVGRWNDVKTNSTIKYSVSAPATGNRPTYKDKCINNLPCLLFNGSSSYLSNSNIAFLSNEMTIFVVAKRVAAVAHTATVSMSNTSGSDNNGVDGAVLFYEGPGGAILQAYRAAFISYANHPGNNIAYIISSTFNPTNNTTHYNGVAQASFASSGSFNSNRFFVGARYESGTVGRYYSGYIAEVILFNRALKIEERKSVEKYLSKKWGITVS